MPATHPEHAFEAALARHGTVLIDGGLATELEAQGHSIDTDLWSAELLLSNPQAIVDAHRAYLDAGAEVIISASYQASREGFMKLGLSPAEADQAIVRSVELACQARDAFLHDHPEVPFKPLVAASIGPWGATRHDGSEYTGDYPIGASELRAFHAQRLALLDTGAADLLACETIPSRVEAQVLCDLLASCQLPSWISFSCRDGHDISDGSAIADVAGMFSQHPRVLAIGVNCTSPEWINALLHRLRDACPDKALLAYPNSGEHYAAADNRWYGTASPVECATAAAEWVRAGARLVGGCCRMGPAHIAAMHDVLG